jgi:hypothetical protein
LLIKTPIAEEKISFEEFTTLAANAIIVASTLFGVSF